MWSTRTDKTPLLSIAEEKVEEEYRWSDFDHAKSLFRTFRKNSSNTESSDIDKTRIVYELSRGDQPYIKTAHILQWCLMSDLTIYRTMLLEVAKKDRNFIQPNFLIQHKSRSYVGSQIADISLADVIHCSISMSEDQVAAILAQIINGLQATSNRNVCYHNLKASNVFISRSGAVQLAAFERDLNPGFLAKIVDNPDCQGIGNLAIHMILKQTPDVPPNNREAKAIHIQSLLSNCSPNLLDFLERCYPPLNSDRGSVKRLADHHFLRSRGEEQMRGCLLPLVHNAVLEAASPRWVASERDLAEGKLLSW